MPTENRPSNTEMVSELLPCPFCGQQDVLIERLDSDASVVICQGLTGPHEACLARGPVGVAQNEDEEQPGRDKAVELWNARAEQHQGEYPPCDYCGVIPDYHPWHGSGLLHGVENRHIHACDQCRGLLPLHPGQHQGNPVALPSCKARLSESHDWDSGYRDGWNACLDEIAKLGPLYTHADPGEVERLRAENERLREVIKHSDSNIQRQSLRISNQRTQLAELDALLREVLVGLWPSTPMAIKINVALSASAEPEVKS